MFLDTEDNRADEYCEHAIIDKDIEYIVVWDTLTRWNHTMKAGLIIANVLQCEMREATRDLSIRKILGDAQFFILDGNFASLSIVLTF